MRRLVRKASALTTVVLGASLASADVLVVDASNPNGFVEIQAAINASHSGDTILVKSGSYGPFSITNEALYIVGDTNANVMVYDGVEVLDLGGGRDVVLSNLSIEGQWDAFDPYSNALYLQNDLGSVRVQNCTLVGGTGRAPGTCAGADVGSCVDVAFVGCTVRGGFAANEAPGLSATGSMVAAYDSQFIGSGGVSNCSVSYDGGSGGTGVILDDSFLFASGTTITGGQGGNAPGSPCAAGDGGNGGVGIELHGTTSGSDAELLDTALAGGFGGTGSCSFGCGHDGTAGLPSIVLPGSVLDVVPGSKRVLTVPAVVRELSAFTVNFHGTPGDQVGVLFGPSTSFNYMHALRGVKMVATDHPPLIAASLGFVNVVTGALSASFTLPDLGPGVQSKIVYVQAIVHTWIGTEVLGTPIAVVVLDQAF